MYFKKVSAISQTEIKKASKSIYIYNIVRHFDIANIVEKDENVRDMRIDEKATIKVDR